MEKFGGRGRIILEMRGVTKKFPGVTANDRVNFTLREGEVHCILGENGAGKTTLMNILYGLYTMDGGEIIVDGKHVSIKSPRDALNLGIGMIHQFSTLVKGLSVMENIILGSELERGSFIEKDRCEEEIRRLMKRLKIEVNTRARPEQLSVGERQKVEILRALYRGARILIMDEPTSELTPQEKEELMKTLKNMVKTGDLSSIIFITHKLPDVLAVGDRVTILRRGRVEGVLMTREASTDLLAKKMLGREVSFDISRGDIEMGETVLEIVELSVLREDGKPALKNVSLSVREGEILGIAGVSGNGQRELVEAVMGIRRVYSGRIVFRGNEITNWPPKKIRKLGVGYIPEDREEGILPDLSIAENLVLGVHTEPPLAHRWLLPLRNRWFLRRSMIKGYARKLALEYGVDAPDIDLPARTLSGGNMQRLILARELSFNPDLLLANKPTSGLDVGSQEYIRRHLISERDRGKAILLISEDLDEVLMLSERIAVMYEGEIIGLVSADEATKKSIGLMMVGGR